MMKKLFTKVTCILGIMVMAFGPVQTPLSEIMVVEAARSDTQIVNGVTVTICDSVSDYYYNKMIEWVKGLPFQLRKNLETVTVSEEIPYATKPTQIGVQVGRKVWIKACEVADGKAILYHEAAHVLDYSTNRNLSGSTTWKKIYSKEWAHEGYCSSLIESFAQAVSDYYEGKLEKSQVQTKEFVKEVMTGGYIKAGWVTIPTKQYTMEGNFKVFYSPHVTKAKVAGIVRTGDVVKITGYNHAKQWFRVWYNNTSCYMTVNSISYRPW